MTDSAWKVVHDDSFDRDAPQTVEATGVGLAAGLVELWKRFLYETVQPASYSDGSGVRQIYSEGFSHFTLQIDGHRIRLQGSMAGAGRIKEWVFGGSQHRDDANPEILRAIARAHTASQELGKAGLPILDAAEAAVDLDGFLSAIARIV